MKIVIEIDTEDNTMNLNMDTGEYDSCIDYTQYIHGWKNLTIKQILKDCEEEEKYLLTNC